jgi:glyoxylase-like metal-dependent hydrolase (beta-lactamase superfamily II)
MCGDSFHLQYVGESGIHRNIFLDMGHSKTYPLILKGVISNLVGTSEQIDALFLSHIHDDHIGGASRFIKDIEKDSTFYQAVTDLAGRFPSWSYWTFRSHDEEDFCFYIH